MQDSDDDNDGAFDASDRFPLDGNYVLDSDNDGIGDEGDLLFNAGDACAAAGDGGAGGGGDAGGCWSDAQLLFAAWGVYAVVLGALAAWSSSTTRVAVGLVTGNLERIARAKLRAAVGEGPLVGSSAAVAAPSSKL